MVDPPQPVHGAAWGWHFLPEDRRLTHGDGRAVTVGQTLTCPLATMAGAGLHASPRALDALSCAPGPVVCWVKLSGTVYGDATRLVATERTVLAMADATAVLHRVAVDWARELLDGLGEIDPRCVRALRTKVRWVDGAVDDDALTSAWAGAWEAASEAREAATWSTLQAVAHASSPGTAVQCAVDTHEEATVALRTRRAVNTAEQIDPAGDFGDSLETRLRELLGLQGSAPKLQFKAG